MKQVIYIAHDPITNTEAQVTEYDPALLEAAQDAGIVFIAQDINGNREIVKAADIKEPTGLEGECVLVQPVYVDTRMQAVVDVFDALEALMFPDTMLLAADSEADTATRDPVEVFTEKLAALRTLTQGGEDDEHANN